MDSEYFRHRAELFREEFPNLVRAVGYSIAESEMHLALALDDLLTEEDKLDIACVAIDSYLEEPYIPPNIILGEE